MQVRFLRISELRFHVIATFETTAADDYDWNINAVKHPHVFQTWFSRPGFEGRMQFVYGLFMAREHPSQGDDGYGPVPTQGLLQPPRLPPPA